MSYGLICQRCGVEAPSKRVEFHQNIGALVVRFKKSCKGNLCKNCIHKTFWSFNAVNLSIGWLGTISLILAPCFFINNLVYYFGALGMPATPRDAKRPTLDDAAVQRLRPFVEELFRRGNQGESIPELASSVAQQAQVTPGQVVVYMAAVQRQAAANAPMAQAVPKARGFEVIQNPTMPAPQASPVHPTTALPAAEAARSGAVGASQKTLGIQ
jgi:hypothetical protein